MLMDTDLKDLLDPAPPPKGWRAYHQVTRTATYGFLMALPLLLLYEALILLANQGAQMQVRVGAEVWMKRVLASLGGIGMHALAVVVLVIGLAIFFYERGKQRPLRARYFGWMIAESTLYAIALAFVVSNIVGFIFAAAPVSLTGRPLLFQVAEQGYGMQLALSLGAGLYEELLFRVVLVGGLYWGLSKAVDRTKIAYIVAAGVGALVFSAVHYIGALGDPFALDSFTFRFLFGLALNAVFLVRGFGVAAWTHALYDVMVVSGLFG